MPDLTSVTLRRRRSWWLAPLFLLAAIAVALVLGLGRESFRASPSRPSLAPATATTG